MGERLQLYLRVLFCVLCVLCVSVRKQMSRARSYVCPMCNFEAPTVGLSLSHLRLVHGNDPRFSAQCGLSGCSYTGKSFSAFYSHIYRTHREHGIIQSRYGNSAPRSHEADGSELAPDSGPDPCADVVEADIDLLLARDKGAQQRSSALFLLKLKESKRLSQVAIDEIVHGWDGIFSHSVQRLQAGVEAKLAAAGIDINGIEGLTEVFQDVPTPFEGLETRHKQEKFFRETLGLVEPKEVKIGEEYHKTVFTGTKRRLVTKQDTYQYVPLLLSLRTLLLDPTVLNEIDQCPSRVCVDGILDDFCDGEIFKTHTLFSSDPFALQIIAFYDELELCNPLGTHIKKHKLGIVLFTLGNINPKYRSSLRVINLLIAATAPVIEEHGLDNILLPFVQDLKKLATEGITVTINGNDRTFRGALLAFLADNLASHGLGGFKESFSFALRICRSCYITKDAYKPIYNCAELELRSDEIHCEQCKLLDGPLREHYSKTYGINRRSILLDIPHFSMFNGGLPHDIMHDILEGVAALEMSLLLKHCIIIQRYLSLEDYNFRLTHFDYEAAESNKPMPITNRSILVDGKALRISASQSLLLIRILPLLIGNVVPSDDSNWKCFLLLSKIVDIVVCPWASADLCAVLKLLIEEHHRCFIDCYTEGAIIPKFHYLLHYPRQVLLLGPMIRTWNMRNEAKLNVFKQASRLGNFKNIAFSVAQRHQRLLCYELSSAKLLHSPMEFGPCKESSLPINSHSQEVQSSLKLLIPGVSDNTLVAFPTWVKLSGTTIKSNVYVIIGSDGLHPTFAKVIDILTLVNLVVLRVSHCAVEYFDSHFHAYVIVHSIDQSYVRYDELFDNSVLCAHKKDDTFYIYLKHYVHV